MCNPLRSARVRVLFLSGDSDDILFVSCGQVLFTSGSSVKTLVNIGGSIAKGYILSYRKLMNRR